MTTLSHSLPYGSWALSTASGSQQGGPRTDIFTRRQVMSLHGVSTFSTTHPINIDFSFNDTSGSQLPKPRLVYTKPSIESALIGLSPHQRLSYLIRKEPYEFCVLAVSFIGSIYVLGRALSVFLPNVALLFSWSAFAQSAAEKASSLSSHDLFDWYVAMLMGLVMMVSLGIVVFAKTESKIVFGKDTTKTIIGFVIGFLSGGRGK